TICRALKRANITYKKNTQRYSERKPLLGKIIQFMKAANQLPQEKIGAIDECGFSFGGVPRRSYSRRGLRSFIWKSGKRSANYTLILYIQNLKTKGVVSYEIVEGAVNTNVFHDFLAKVNLSAENKNYLLLDNIKFHHSNKIN